MWGQDFIAKYHCSHLFNRCKPMETKNENNIWLSPEGMLTQYLTTFIFVVTARLHLQHPHTYGLKRERERERERERDRERQTDRDEGTLFQMTEGNVVPNVWTVIIES